MPTIKEVLGDPQPKTYVPFRNMILLSLTMAKAESSNASHVFTGLQIHDEYGYWDTTGKFVDSINAVAAQNRNHKVKIEAFYVYSDKVIPTTISLYRPLTKSGDPRIWFAKLNEYAQPYNLLALLFHDSQLFIINASKSEILKSHKYLKKFPKWFCNLTSNCYVIN